MTLTFDLKSLHTLPLSNQCEWNISQIGPNQEERLYGHDRYLYNMCAMTLTFDVEKDVQT